MSRLLRACGPSADRIDALMQSMIGHRRAIVAVADFADTMSDFINESMRLADLVENAWKARDEAASETSAQDNEVA